MPFHNHLPLPLPTIPCHTYQTTPYHTIPYYTIPYHAIPSEHNAIYTVSCPSYPSREAPPERAGHSKTIRFTRFRAPPTYPGRPRLSELGIRKPYDLQVVVPLQSEQGTRKPYYLSGFVPFPPFLGCPARATSVFANHIPSPPPPCCFPSSPSSAIP